MKIAATFVLALSTMLANANAPADKYFGRLKMSPLHIRYEILQVKSRYDNHKLLPENAEHLAGFAAESYYDWAARYPGDSWLASTGVSLARLYEDLPGATARASAARVLSFVAQHFKNTKYSKTAASEMLRLPVKPYPQWAVKMRATPSPAPSASGSPGTSPKPTISPRASSPPH